MQKRMKIHIPIWYSVLIIFIDQASKILVKTYYSGLVHYNPGISFSIQFSPWVQTLLIAAALVTGIIYTYSYTRSHPTIWSYAALAGISGGAISNIIDRLVYNGKVLDFISIPYFAVFNFADICISMGVVALIISMYREERLQKFLKE